MSPRCIRILLCISFLATGSALVTVVEIIELRQEWIPSDPSGVHHNLSVALGDHEYIDEEAKWTLTFINEEATQPPHDCTSTNEDQTALMCDGNVENANYLILSATKGDDSVAFGYAEVVIEDFMSRAAWVGKDSQVFLRVATGSLDEVQAGTQTCTEPTCYYRESTFSDPDTLLVERCQDLDAKINGNDQTLKLCDDIVTFPPLMDDLDLLLSLDQQVTTTGKLTLTHTSTELPASVELVVHLTDDDTILVENCPATDDDSKDNYDGSCSYNVPLQQDSDSLQRTVSLINADGYVINTTSFTMEVYRVNSKRLTESALEVRWDKGSPGTYLVSVDSSSLLVSCDSDTTPCLTFFTGLTLSGPTVKVRVQKEEEQKVVETTLILDDPPETKAFISKLSSVSQDPPISEVVVTEEAAMTSGVVREGARTNPDSVVLVRVLQNPADDGDVPVVEYFPGNVTSHDLGGYTALFDCDVLDTQEEFDFLVNAYDTDGSVLSAGEVTLQIAELSPGGWWVGAKAANDSASLRVKAGVPVTSPSGHENVIKHCLVSGVCYVLEVGGDQGVAPEVCQDGSATTPSICTREVIAFTVFSNFSSVVVVTVANGSLEVSVSGAEGSPGQLEVLAYNPADNNAILTNVSQTCQSEVGRNSESIVCVQPLLVKNVPVMNVLVVGLDESGQNVVSSALIPVIGFTPSNGGTETWVIVVSVLCSVLGAAFIIFGIVVVVKKQKSKKTVKRSGRDSRGDTLEMDDEGNDFYHGPATYTNPQNPDEENSVPYTSIQQQPQPPQQRHLGPQQKQPPYPPSPAYASQQPPYARQQPPYARQQPQESPYARPLQQTQQHQQSYARSEPSKVYETPYSQQQQQPSNPHQYPRRPTQPPPQVPDYDQQRRSRPVGMLPTVSIKPTNRPQPLPRY